QLQLLVPAVEAGWYEIRLLSPDPVSGLAVPIARSQPIRIDGSIPPPPASPPPTAPGASCGDGAASPCDDGDPCTDDACVPGLGCVSTPVSGFASVMCTCGRSVPAACADQELPTSVSGRRQRACGLFAAAAGTARRPLAVRRLRKAVQTLTGSIRLVAGRRKTVSADCAGALKDELRDTPDRAARVPATEVTLLCSRRPSRMARRISWFPGLVVVESRSTCPPESRGSTWRSRARTRTGRGDRAGVALARGAGRRGACRGQANHHQPP